MPRGIAAINRLWEELKAAKRAEEEASLAQHEADASPVRWDNPSALPPAYEPDPQAAPKPSYGLLDWIPTLWGDPPGYIRPRAVSLAPASSLAHGFIDVLPAQWGGQPGQLPFAPRPEPWTASLATMPPRPSAFEALQPALPGPRVPTAGGGHPPAIAGWPTSALAGVPPRPVPWRDASVSLFPATPPASPLGHAVKFRAGRQDDYDRSPSDESPRVGESRSDPRVLSDATPDNLWIPGAQYAAEAHGMHWFSQQHWKGIPREALKVFDAAGLGKTGKLPIQTRPRSVPQGAGGQALGHWFDKPHQEYNKAVGELFERYLKDNQITRGQMTADHAHRVLRAIAASEDPRILGYRQTIYRIWRMYHLRTGIRGGSD
jgi:hypothetical protein